MIKVTMGNNLKRTDKMLSPNTTLREALELAGISCTVGMLSLDGSTLAQDDLDKTFADFGIVKQCFLLNVAKADNGV